MPFNIASSTNITRIPQQLLLAGSIFFAGAICAYEQGSYFLFDIVEPQEAPRTESRLVLDPSILKEQKRGSQTLAPDKSISEFEFNLEPSFDTGAHTNFDTKMSFDFEHNDTDSLTDIDTANFGLNEAKSTDASEDKK